MADMNFYALSFFFKCEKKIGGGVRRLPCYISENSKPISMKFGIRSPHKINL